MLLIQSWRVEHHYTQTSTNNANKTWTLLQTTGGKYEPNIVFYEEIVADITTRNEELKIAWSHHIWFYFYVFLHLLLFTKRYRNKKCIECVFLPKQKIFGQQQFKTNTMHFVENAMYRSTEKESSCRSRNQQTLLFPQNFF